MAWGRIFFSNIIGMQTYMRCCVLQLILIYMQSKRDLTNKHLFFLIFFVFNIAFQSQRGIFFGSVTGIKMWYFSSGCACHFLLLFRVLSSGRAINDLRTFIRMHILGIQERHRTFYDQFHQINFFLQMSPLPLAFLPCNIKLGVWKVMQVLHKGRR